MNICHNILKHVYRKKRSKKKLSSGLNSVPWLVSPEPYPVSYQEVLIGLYMLLSRPWQIIPKDSPIILFFHSQISHLAIILSNQPIIPILFSNSYSKPSQYTKLFWWFTIVIFKNSGLFWILIYGQSLHCDHMENSMQTQQKLIVLTSEQPCTFKFNPKTTAFKLTQCTCSVQESVYCNKQSSYLHNWQILVPIILK